MIDRANWEEIGEGPTGGVLYRVNVKGGWLVLRTFNHADVADIMVFVPDADGTWAP